MSNSERNARTSLEIATDYTRRAPVRVQNAMIDDVRLAFFDSVQVVCVHVVCHDEEAASFEKHRPQVPVVELRTLETFKYN